MTFLMNDSRVGRVELCCEERVCVCVLGGAGQQACPASSTEFTAHLFSLGESLVRSFPSRVISSLLWESKTELQK